MTFVKKMTLDYCHLILLLLVLVQTSATAGEERLWCYECNVNISSYHSTDCNDPFMAGSVYKLKQCPPFSQCLKSILVYKHVHMTIRGCVLDEMAEDYCEVPNIFSDALVECSFCKENGCNAADARVFNQKMTYISIFTLIFNYRNLLYFQL